jgi:ubiquinone biosynthesis protein COQ9
MLDTTTPRGAIIAAALRLAAERPWARVTLADIADAAGATLVGLKREYDSKGEILAAFTAAVDDEVLRQAARPAPDQPARDALFEVLMCRFDVLAPYKPALRSIVDGAMPEPAQIQPWLVSQRWMLEAAGVSGAGADGALKVMGLATVYASVFRTWLADDDPGHARTMAALDRRLRRGERTLGRVEAVCSAVTRLASAVAGRRSPQRRRDAEDGDARAEPAPGPSL